MTQQRLWRSTCPQCGAPVELRAADTAVAVCGFCRSTLARDGEALRRMGSAAEVFEDYSSLQLGASGTWNGRAFTVIGRLQWRTADASWNEWHMLLDEDGGDAPARRAWLSEDNGRYVIAVDAPVPADVPNVGDAARVRDALLDWRAGTVQTIGGRPWSVASVVAARIAAAQGELTQVPTIDEAVTVVDLRDPVGRVATLAAGARRVSWSIGESVELATLALQGLRDTSQQQATTRGVECPSCGTALKITLDTTKSIACHQCKAIVDLSQGVGGDMAFSKQAASRVASTGALAKPLIPLGSTGDLELDGAKTTWQVVGYQVREEVDAEDFEPPWTEYLLYSRAVGFAFLVHSGEGWSWAVPIAGVPTVAGSHAKWQDRSYTKRYEYESKTSWVLGEFYWNVQRDQRTRHADYAGGPRRLNREQQGQEVTWSEGRTIPATAVAKAFGVALVSDVAGDVKPLALSSAIGVRAVVIIVIVLVLLTLLLSTCSRDRCGPTRNAYGSSSVEYQQCLNSSRSSRTGGSTWGGSGGSSGGHK